MSAEPNPFEAPRTSPTSLAREARYEALSQPGLGVVDLCAIAAKVMASMPGVVAAYLAFVFASSWIGASLERRPMEYLAFVFVNVPVGMFVRVVIVRRTAAAVAWPHAGPQSAASLFGSVIGVGILVGMFFVFGLLLLVIPGIYVLVRYAFYPDWIVLHDGGDPLANSARLVKGDGWRVTGYLAAQPLVLVASTAAFAMVTRTAAPAWIGELVRLAMSGAIVAWSFVWSMLFMHLSSTKPMPVDAPAAAEQSEGIVEDPASA